ncbi:hypothetical protein L7F22_016531 [Adiantum nelumboides]|nr:hypothetical protein [Adiantum nelumboides]
MHRKICEQQAFSHGGYFPVQADSWDESHYLILASSFAGGCSSGSRTSSGNRRLRRGSSKGLSVSSDFHLSLDEAEKFANWLTSESQRQAINLKKITTSARQMHAENERHLLETMTELENVRGMVDQYMVDVDLAKLQAETERNRYEETVSKLDKVTKELEDERQLRKETEENLVLKYQLRKEAEEKASKETTEKSTARVMLQEQFNEYSYQELRAATNEFSDDNKLGEGSFGPVFKGKLHSTIAIKVLSREGSKACDEFQNVTSFKMRFRICLEVAAALLFLHSSSQPIVHYDLKARNFLLDNHFISKIGNLGLAKLASNNVITGKEKMPLGMYLHPDYQISGSISCESDVFSLGIIMLQLLTGRRAVGVADIVEDAVYNGNLEDVLDKGSCFCELAMR